jgi:hypothetical protein
LENNPINERHEALRMEVVELLVKTYSDDTELGKTIREFVSIKENTKDNFEL